MTLRPPGEPGAGERALNAVEHTEPGHHERRAPVSERPPHQMQRFQMFRILTPAVAPPHPVGAAPGVPVFYLSFTIF